MTISIVISLLLSTMMMIVVGDVSVNRIQASTSRTTMTKTTTKTIQRIPDEKTNHDISNLPRLEQILRQKEKQQQQINEHNGNGNNSTNNNNEDSTSLIQPIIGMKFYTNDSYYYDIIPPGTKLLTTAESLHLNRNYPHMTAIIHIGPMKTGSSAIQELLRHVVGNPAGTETTAPSNAAPSSQDHRNSSSSDSDSSSYISVAQYVTDRHQPVHIYDDDGRQRSFYHDFHIVGCFRDPKLSTYGFIKCQPHLLPTVHEIASHHHDHHIILSHESLSSDANNIRSLKQFLSPWKKHRIVAAYRRYYDWLISLHNQATKYQTTSERRTILDFLEQEYRLQNNYNDLYIVYALDRWKRHYNNTKKNNNYDWDDDNELDIHVMNMHEAYDDDDDDYDIRHSFYCQVIPNTTDVCQRYLARKEREKLATQSIVRSNPSSNVLTYIDMAYYAKEMNLWSETMMMTNDHNNQTITIKDVSHYIQHYQENILLYSPYDFGMAKTCPSQEIIEYLLQRTLDTERYLFPEYYHAVGERQIIDDFYQHIVTTKLCHIDAKLILQQNNTNGTMWRNFFVTTLPAMIRDDKKP